MHLPLQVLNHIHFLEDPLPPAYIFLGKHYFCLCMAFQHVSVSSIIHVCLLRVGSRRLTVTQW